MPSEACPLVADFGGTFARVARVENGRLRQVRTYGLADFAAPAELLAADADHRRRGEPPVSVAVLAVAAPVGRGPLVLTNAQACFDRAQIAAALGVSARRVRFINDFEALALALPELPWRVTRAVGGGRRQAGAMAAIGPGTGLGVAGVVPVAGGWQALPGEGGHVTLAPDTDREAAILARARMRWPHVSAERLLSGRGLPVLHALCAEVDGAAFVPRTTPELIDAAKAGAVDAVVTLETFCGWLGSVAGNLALTLGARGGVFIGGGLVPRCVEFFAASSFRRRFEAKGRFAGYLASIPTRVILALDPALRGAARVALQFEENPDHEHADR